MAKLSDTEGQFEAENVNKQLPSSPLFQNGTNSKF
jgi:hypothetical protein